MKKTIRVSGSIRNFRKKLLQRYSDYEEWSLSRLFRPCIFFGLYRPLDYLWYFLHMGRKTAFWAGSDILHVNWMNFLVLGGTHYCENEVERKALYERGILAEIHPMLFDDPSRFGVCYEKSQNPKVFLCAHEGREKEYGVDDVERIAPLVPEVTFVIYGITGTSEHPNVLYRGMVSEERFNEEISGYQGFLRFNVFDGCSEGMAKSILMGHYPATAIRYPHIQQIGSDESLIDFLRMLRYRDFPNPHHTFWREKLCKRIEAS